MKYILGCDCCFRRRVCVKVDYGVVVVVIRYKVASLKIMLFGPGEYLVVCWLKKQSDWTGQKGH